MEVKFDKIDFPIEIPAQVIDKRNLTVKKYDQDHQILFRIEIEGKTLVRVYENGNIVLHLSDYPGRPYHYEQSYINEEEVCFKLFPPREKE